MNENGEVTSRIIRAGYDPTERVQKDPGGDSLAKQSFKDECDINVLMKRYEKTGIIAHANEHGGRYGDFIDAPMYHEAMNMIREADEAFLSLPASVRRRFDNDPALFLEFAQDEANADELVKMGLAERRKEAPEPSPSPDPVPQTDQEPSGP